MWKHYSSAECKRTASGMAANAITMQFHEVVQRIERKEIVLDPLSHSNLNIFLCVLEAYSLINMTCSTLGKLIDAPIAEADMDAGTIEESFLALQIAYLRVALPETIKILTRFVDDFRRWLGIQDQIYIGFRDFVDHQLYGDAARYLTRFVERGQLPTEDERVEIMQYVIKLWDAMELPVDFPYAPSAGVTDLGIEPLSEHFKLKLAEWLPYHWIQRGVQESGQRVSTEIEDRVNMKNILPSHDRQSINMLENLTECIACAEREYDLLSQIVPSMEMEEKVSSVSCK
ncbi:MAG: hypothetical protein A3J38_00805 [Gammaproteobacteria bacterium RIFCSPHIGHO2_12_FULL_45_9]|nr:MAG: hypothetical protein A3J38_00805 [Gammaproteobacteria bacterium RIFCSPHIGHO2_12_FULL_45_9]